MDSKFNGQNIRLATTFLTILILAFTGQVSSATAGNHQASGLVHMQTAAPSGVVVVKMSSGPTAGKSLAPQHLAQAIKHLLPNPEIKPRFTDLSKSLGNTELARYYQMEAGHLDPSALLKLVVSLNSNPNVEVAFLEPVAVPASLGFDAFNQEASPAPRAPVEDIHVFTNTPDFESAQGYLDDAPLGVGAWAMRDQPGSDGEGITVIDVEGGWLWTHEDLPAPSVELGEQVDDPSWRNHGTAVLSEIRGTDNGFGVTGIAPECSVGCSSIGATSTAGALAAAVDQLERGDLLLIELHAPGPNSNGIGQFGYVPMEYWPDIFDTIRLATAKGIIICEAAGNGAQNLDGPEYEGLFDRTLRDSGAILCGATDGGELYSAGFSNNGSRVDLNGWGYSVTAAGYGNLQSGEETQWYTSTFSGTSSASPIVTGSVASLQGMTSFTLDARLARDIFLETGTAMTSGNAIGVRPNLVQAFAHADTIVGVLSGTLTDATTGLPIAGAMVQADNNGSFTMTGDDGVWQMPLIHGAVELEFSSYFYHSETTATFATRQEYLTVDMALTPLDLINITGLVHGSDGPLAQVTVTPTDQPIAGTTTDMGGEFSINVPALYDYTLLFDGVPGYGARVEIISTAGLVEDAIIHPLMPTTSENFAMGDGGFIADAALWTHGTPPLEVTGGAFDGWACWGIGMDGEYGDNENDSLLSPLYNLSGVAGDDYFLSFHYYSATESGFDGVNLEVFGPGGFEILTPLEGYTDPGLGGLDGSAGWSGHSERWQGTVFDITDFTAGDFQFRLNFGSDNGFVQQGFYFDAISFGRGESASLVGVDGAPQLLSPQLKAWPNPFNPQVNLEYAVTRPGHLQVAVFDLRGNRVRTLLNAPVAETRGTLSWDGRQDNGRMASSGVYLVQLVGPGQKATSQRVVLAK